MSRYMTKKAELVEEAKIWQNDFAEHEYSYGEILEWQNYFEKNGKRYGLLREFRENGII